MSRTLRIAQVISTPPFAWETGGCARVAFDLSRALAIKGHKVTIITTDLYKANARYPKSKRREVVDGVEIVRFPYIGDWLAWKHKLYLSPGLVRFLKKHLKDYDIVHLQDLISLQAVATSSYCIRYKVPYILTVHGSLPWLTERKFANRTFLHLFGNNIMDGAKRIVVLNESEADLCRSFGIEDGRTVVIPNGVVKSDYQELPRAGAFREKYGIAQDSQIILYLGRLHASKGIDLLIEAFAKLSKECPLAKLVLVGPDDGIMESLKGRAEELGIREKILIAGYVEHQDKLAALIDSDLLVTPYFSGFPITFVEACILGRPIVTTDRSDNLDWIHGKAGLVVKDDREELKNAIMKLLNDHQMRDRLGEGGKALASDLFDWDHIAERISTVYEEAVCEDKR